MKGTTEKPHIMKIEGLWYCWGGEHNLYGFGYTPLKAYRDWQEQIKIQQRR